MVKSAQCRQRLSTAATFLCYPSAKRWAPVTFAGVGSQHSLPLDNCRKMKPFFFKTNRLFFMRSLPKLLSCFHPKQHHSPTKHFSVNHSLTSTMIIPPYVCVKSCSIPVKCFYNSSTDYDAMLQYRYPVVQLFCCVLLEVAYIFVINVAVKQLKK